MIYNLDLDSGYLLSFYGFMVVHFRELQLRANKFTYHIGVHMSIIQILGITLPGILDMEIVQRLVLRVPEISPSELRNFWRQRDFMSR